MVTHQGPICDTHALSTLVVANIHWTPCLPLAFIPGKTGVGFVLFFVFFFYEEPHDDPGINKVENADGEKESGGEGGGPEPDPQNAGLSARCIFKLESVPGQDP